MNLTWQQIVILTKHTEGHKSRLLCINNDENKRRSPLEVLKSIYLCTPLERNARNDAKITYQNGSDRSLLKINLSELGLNVAFCSYCQFLQMKEPDCYILFGSLLLHIQRLFYSVGCVFGRA